MLAGRSTDVVPALARDGDGVGCTTRGYCSHGTPALCHRMGGCVAEALRVMGVVDLLGGRQ